MHSFPLKKVGELTSPTFLGENKCMTLRRPTVETKDDLDFTSFIIWCIQGLS